MGSLDLFSGAGGATLAMRSLGLDPLGFDNDADACATHRAAGHRTEEADLATFSWYRWRGWNNRRISVVHASPPCQPFSAAGKKAGRLDRRDGMPFALRAFAALRPALITVENVKGLTYKTHADYLAWFLGELAGLGYTVDHRVLNAADYGVPQTRQRLFVVGHRGDVTPKWPDPTHAEGGADGLLPWVSMAEALGWSAEACVDQHRGAGFLERGGLRRHRPAAEPAPTVPVQGNGGGGTYWTWRLNTGRDWKEGQDRAAAQTLPDSDPAPTVSSVLGQWWRQRPATTVNGDPRISRPGHHAEDESGSQQRGAVRVELEELAVLQGFPADYPFVGNRTSRARQIGNAVPPALLAAVIGANLEMIS